MIRGDTTLFRGECIVIKQNDFWIYFLFPAISGIMYYLCDYFIITYDSPQSSGQKLLLVIFVLFIMVIFAIRKKPVDVVLRAFTISIGVLLMIFFGAFLYGL